MPKYNSLEDIERLNPALPNETDEQRAKRLTRIRQARKRFNDKQKKIKSTPVPLISTSSIVEEAPSTRASSIIEEEDEPISTRTSSIMEEDDNPPSSRTRSKTTASATERKRKSRAALTEKQKEEIRKKDKIARQIRYIATKEQIRRQFHQIGYCNIENYIEIDRLENGRHRFERMNNICNHCYALKWKDEPKAFCCINGQIVLASLSPAPDAIYKLLTEKDPITNEPYIRKIRAYNHVLAFISM